MIPLKHFSSLVLFICIFGTCRAADEQIRILGVGNSFTRNAMQFLPEVIESNPELTADVAYAYIGGASMDKHVALAHMHEADSSQGKGYQYFLNGQKIKGDTSLQTMLEDGAWDYITIQQVSTKSYKIETYYPYVEQLIRYIKKYAPNAEIVIHETWAHSIDSHRTKWPLLPDDMYAGLHAAYGQISEEFDLRVIPVGTAFQHAKQLPEWDYQPTNVDVSSLKYPEDTAALPDESKSLHKIFYWQKSENGQLSVGNDGFHANRNGQYLGSMVWYEFFFEQDVRDLTYKPEGFSDEQAASLRAVAHYTVHDASM